MDSTQRMIKQAVANLADFQPLIKQAAEKVALTPAVGGQLPAPADVMGGGMPPGGAPPMDPSMGGGMPPGMPPGMSPGGAPPMDPSMGGGMPPMDPSMGGGMPPMDPASMDPAAMGGMPPEGELPPEGGAPANNPQDDQDGDGKPDVMVPLRAITEHTVGVIEATKGRRTADAPPAKAGGPAGAGPQSPISSLGGAPSDAPMALPGLGPKQAAARVEELIAATRKYRTR